MDYYSGGIVPVSMGGHGTIIADLLYESNPRMMHLIAILSGLCGIGCLSTIMFFATMYHYRNNVFKYMDQWDKYNEAMNKSLMEVDKTRRIYTTKLEQLNKSKL
jgi:hypothetical protein